MPHVLIVAGPNGAGKTTYARAVAARWPAVVFINADEIARRAPVQFDRKRVSLWAAHRMIETLANHLEARDDIMLETTLATRRYLGAIPQWKALGYDVELHFLRLPSVAAAIARVGRRVAAGGHDIPRQDIERRFHRGLEYLALYKPAVDQWALFDNSDDGLELVMMGTRDER